MASLPDQASQLLLQPASELATPAVQAELLRLALACHSRMLELGDADRRTAAAHALAGADLLQALTSQPGPHPDWLAVHQEQCCRYGAIWIHSLLTDGETLPADWPRRGATLLEALQPLHAEPLPWVPVLRADLLRDQPADPDQHRLTAVVVGNCQSHPLMLGLEPLLPTARILFSPPVHLATAADVQRLHDWLAETDLLICHRVQPGYREGIGLDTASLRRLLPATGRCLVLPNLHYEGCHPWIGYSHDPDGRLEELEAESPLGPYHDFLAMAAAAADLSAADLLGPGSAALTALLQDTHRHSLAELRRREQDCDLGLADWIEAEHRRRPLMHTINHPTQAALDQLLRRLVAQIPQALSPGNELFDAHEHLGALTLPIHPWVHQALGLGGWAESWGQRRGSPLPIAQQLNESLAFYRRHPGLIAANANHPKLALAQRCLELREVAAPPPPLVEVLHLHGFKCAGSTFIGSLERACAGRVAYVETPRSNQRLAWQWLEQQRRLPIDSRAITSHLVTLPPPEAVARLKVAFLRDPLDRIRSAFRFQRHVQASTPHTTLASYAAAMARGILANYQSRQLSGQPLETWPEHQGWQLDPDSLDLDRRDLFIGLVERYDESIVLLEHRLEELGCPMDLAYPQALNTTSSHHGDDQPLEEPPDEIWQALCGIDQQLYQRVSAHLQARIDQLPDHPERLTAFRDRCRSLREQGVRTAVKPYQDWILIEEPPLPG